MKTLKDLTEVESASADKIAAYKKAGGTIKKHSPDAKRIKKATDSFKAKLAKTMKIQSAQDEKEQAEKEANKAYKNGDFTTALKKWKYLAKHGNAYAQAMLGYIYLVGKEEIPKNFKEALRWNKIAAEQGNVSAQINLGSMYTSNEFGVQKDYKEALLWYRMAAEQGNKKAKEDLKRLS